MSDGVAEKLRIGCGGRTLFRPLADYVGFDADGGGYYVGEGFGVWLFGEDGGGVFFEVGEEAGKVVDDAGFDGLGGGRRGVARGLRVPRRSVSM